MTTPYKLVTQKYDSLWVKLKKWVARWLWNDLTKLPEPAKGYPMPKKDEWCYPKRTLDERADDPGHP